MNTVLSIVGLILFWALAYIILERAFYKKRQRWVQEDWEQRDKDAHDAEMREHRRANP